MSTHKISGHTKIGDIATSVPAAIQVFEQYGVDFCCGGDKPLEEALEGTGLATGDILAEIEQAAAAEAEEDVVHENLAQSSPVELINHIEKTHHKYLKGTLPRVGQEMSTVLSVHGDAHPELRELARLVEDLRREVEAHLEQEEQQTFPAIRAGAGAAPSDQELTQLESEHDFVGSALKSIRGITSGFEPPADACPTYAHLYLGLQELEADIHRHVHLENNVLFPALRERRGARA